MVFLPTFRFGRCLSIVYGARDTPSPSSRFNRLTLSAAAAIRPKRSARLPVQLFAQRSACSSDPRASRRSVLLPVVCFRSVCPSRSVLLLVKTPTPALALLPPPRCAAGAQKVGAPRAPENFLIDPRAPYSTCDSSSPLLISFPVAAARTSLSFPRRESRYRRHLRFHRRR